MPNADGSINPVLVADDGERIAARDAARQMMKGELGTNGLLAQSGLSPFFVLHLMRELREDRGEWETLNKAFLLDEYLAVLQDWYTLAIHREALEVNRRLSLVGWVLSGVGVFVGFVHIGIALLS